MDRLEEIKEKWHWSPGKEGDGGLEDDVLWLIAEVEKLSDRPTQTYLNQLSCEMGDKIQSLQSQLEAVEKELEAQRPGWCPICHERIYNEVNKKIDKLEVENASNIEQIKKLEVDLDEQDTANRNLQKKLTASEKKVEELEDLSFKTDCDHPWVIHKDGRNYCSECGEIK